jgi:hypothetical protein
LKYVKLQEFGVEEERGVICGVYDGHGPYGHLVARRVRDVLPLKLLEALPKGKGIKGIKCGDMEVPDWRRAFMKAYRGMDKDLRSHPSLDCFCSGSTAVTLLKIVILNHSLLQFVSHFSLNSLLVSH